MKESSPTFPSAPAALASECAQAGRSKRNQAHQNLFMQNSRPEGGCFNIRYDAEVSKRNSPSHLTYREKLLRFLFQGRQFGQQESDQENDRRTENYCKVGMQRTAQAIERRALVQKR